MRKKLVSLFLVFIMLSTNMGMAVLADTKLPEVTDEPVSSASPEIKSDEDTDKTGNDGSLDLFADGGNLTADLAAGEVTITENGTYNVTGSAETTFTNSIVVKSGVTATVTLTDVVINSATAPIKVEAGAVLTLNIKNVNSLKATANYYAGIAVYENGTLIIRGDGTLNVQGGATHGAGIGSNRNGTDGSSGVNGTIIIEDGTINATGGTGGAGIGPAYPSPTSLKFIPGSIEINGGIITATGGAQAAGIGGAGGVVNGPITINGGYIKASSKNTRTSGIGPGQNGDKSSVNKIVINGGSIDADIDENCPVEDKSANQLKKVTLTIPDGAGKKVTVDSWPGGAAVADANGNIYPYVISASSEKSFAVHCDGKIYYTLDIDETPNLKLYDGDPCQCDQTNSSITLDVPDDIMVNKIAQSKQTIIKTNFNPSEGCTYPIHSITASYELTKDNAPLPETIAKIDDNILTAYYNENEKNNRITLKASASLGSFSYEAEKEIEIISDNSSKFNLSDGSIIISKGSTGSTLRVQHGSIIYNDIPEETTIYVYMNPGASETENTITVNENVTARVEIENVNILSEAVKNPLTLGDAAKLTLALKGNNRLEARRDSAVYGYPSTSELIIENGENGKGRLETKSGLGAGIGNIKSLTVNGGEIKAEGGNGGLSGNGGAGIGGARDGKGIEVTINDGYVEAVGSGSAAGIGGGESNQNGGSFTINGGTVIASSSGDGIGIGGKSSAGQVNINGGSVVASFLSQPQKDGKRQYLVTTDMKGVSGKTNVTYSIGDDNSNPIPATTDENGKLYLYLNSGEQWIRIYKDGQMDEDSTYYRNMRISTNNNNIAHCILHPKAELKSFKIAGQIGETDITDSTVTVTVPYNIVLNRVAPIADFDGSEALPINLNFNNEDKTAVYTVYADNKESKEYTIKLIVQDEPNPLQASEFDVSVGNVLIYGEYVSYGNTRYSVNEAGYIIKGESSANRVVLDYAATHLPPITFDNLTLSSQTQAVPMSINVSADITVSGFCSITSGNSNAVEIKKLYDDDNPVVNITGSRDSRLLISGGNSNHAITLGESTSLSMTGVSTSILADNGTNAIARGNDGAGEFITDSQTVMRIISSETPDIQPKDKDGSLLYQLTAHINAKDKSLSTCTYNEEQYYVGDDATLYLMLPNSDEFPISVTYNNMLYSGSTAIENRAAEITLDTIKVEDLKFSNTLSYQGGDVVFELTGTRLAGNVKVGLKRSNEDTFAMEAPVTDNSNKVTINIPGNDSQDRAVTYTVWTVVGDEETRWGTITVARNDTIARITEFEIENQIGNTVITEGTGNQDNIITIYMPYDHQYKSNYTAAKITTEPANLLVTPPSAFYMDVDNYMRGKYIVTARDGVTTKEYFVRIRKNQTLPSITALSFNNPNSSKGGTIAVTARGKATNTIGQAENPENRKVYILLYNGETEVACEETTQVMENGVAVFTANVSVPENDSDDNDATYTLKVKIGSEEQTNITSNTTVTVPRKNKSISGLKNISIAGGKTQISGTDMTITMPYDADITSLAVSEIEYEEENANASCSPARGELVDFTNPVKYTVTAENGVDKTEYMVTVVKEETPVAKSIEFKSPDYSSAGGVEVIIKGDYLDNAANTLNNSPTITVGGRLTSGDSTNSTIVAVRARKATNSEDYVATIMVPQNGSDTIRLYELFVDIGGTRQNLSGETTLTVPAKEENIAVISDVILAEGQRTVVSDNKIYIYVPYNANIKNIVPKIYWSGRDNGLSPAETEAQDFTQPVTYTVYAADGQTFNTYEVITARSDLPGITGISFDQPENAEDVNIEIDIQGRFITHADERDVITISAVSSDGKIEIPGTVEYDTAVFGGHATAKIKLNKNETSSEQIYYIKIDINGEPQSLGFWGVITVPGQKLNKITEFRVNGQIDSSDIQTSSENNTGTILFKMPYDADITSISPYIQIEGDSVSPASGEAVNFDNEKRSVEYTVRSAGQEPRIYTVTLQRDGKPSISSVEVSNVPSIYKGTNVNVDIRGIFFDSAEVKAVPIDENGNDIEGAEVLDGNVTVNKNEASAVINVPDNNTTEDKRYRIDVYLDGFSEPISYTNPKIITVPYKKTLAITQFRISGSQVGTESIGEDEIIVKVVYDTDLSQIRPTIAIDGDNVSPASNETVNFDNATQSLKYTVSANGYDEDREYTVYIQRDGDPTVSRVVKSKLSSYKGGKVSVLVEGVFIESLKVTAVPNDGGESVTSTITSSSEGFEEGKASVLLDIGGHTSYEDKIYTLEFELDGKSVPYTGNKTITVPRRTRRNITSFTMPGIADGTITGNDINVNVPYGTDISEIKPEIEFDADSISPSLDEAQDFSNDDNKVTYTLSSEDDEDVIYTVNIIRGAAPKISSMTVNGQVGETVYDGDTITITMPLRADLTSITPIVTVSDGADYEPKEPQNFTNSIETPQIYTVTDQNGAEIQYKVTIKRQERVNQDFGESSSSRANKPTATPIPEKTPSPVTETPEPTPTPDDTPKTMPYIRGYEEFGLKLFKPENTITRAEVAAIMSLIDADFDENVRYLNVFGDVADDAWYSNYVNYASEKGYIQGYDDGTSRPENNITRAEFVSIMARYMNVELYTGMSLFKDIDNVAWCRNQINTLAQLGIVNGYDDAMFKPDQFISRAETVTIVNRVLGRKMTDEIREKLNNPFDDITSDHWAYDNVLLASCEY